jgi:dethiobiotin synthetase
MSGHPSIPRPGLLVLVIGTATDIGKTWVGGRTLEALVAAGVTVAARKPAQSFDPDDDGPTDADVLAQAAGGDPDEVCLPHRNYRVPMAPPMAADELGLPVPTLRELMAELTWPRPVPDVGWVETVGGPRSPIAVDGDAVDLCAHLDPDLVVLVGDAGLGTVNAVLVSAEPFEDRDLVVVLNRFDPDESLHRRNRDWLTTREGLEVVTDPEDLAQHLLARAR